MLIYSPFISVFTKNTNISIDLKNGTSFAYKSTITIKSVEIKVFKDRTELFYDCVDNNNKSYIYQHDDLVNIAIHKPSYEFPINSFKDRFNEYDIDYVSIIITKDNTHVKMFKDDKLVVKQH